jgi:hypothetical protein
LQIMVAKGSTYAVTLCDSSSAIAKSPKAT